jgi:hypothetical protein
MPARIARVSERVDKLLNEAQDRRLVESYNIRSDKPGIREFYLGALVLAKAAVSLGVSEPATKAIFKNGFTKLGGGSQQIVLASDQLKDWAIKVDRDSLRAADKTLPEHHERVTGYLEFARTTYNDPLAANSMVFLAESPFKRDDRACIATLQPKVLNMSDLMTTNNLQWQALRNRAPHIGGQLLSFVEATDDLLNDTGNNYLPDLFGIRNLVVGDLVHETGVYLVDPAPIAKEKLRETGSAFGWSDSYEEFKYRLDKLHDLSQAA